MENSKNSKEEGLSAGGKGTALGTKQPSVYILALPLTCAKGALVSYLEMGAKQVTLELLWGLYIVNIRV